jgi:hypothetical protein
MSFYEDAIRQELRYWQIGLRKEPGVISQLPNYIQKKINNWLPEKYHQGITYIIEKMVKGIQFGSSFFNTELASNTPLEMRESLVRERIQFYKKTAAVEGAVTGAGGIVLGMVDFAAFLSLKFKMMMEIGSIYGYSVKDYRERLFLLYAFQLAFSSSKRRMEIIHLIKGWDQYYEKLPAKVEDFDWRTFQLEYRDYIDLVKLAQLIPLIGAPVGAVANYKLITHLGETVMNCYRLRYFFEKDKKID